jgi:hypothetical protein
MTGQAQIIVAAERQQRPAIRRQRRLLRTGNQAAGSVQPGLLSLFYLFGEITHRATKVCFQENEIFEQSTG